MSIVKKFSHKINSKASGKRIALGKVPYCSVQFNPETGDGDIYMLYDSVSHHTANRPDKNHRRGKKQFKSKEDFIRQNKNLEEWLKGNVQPIDECRAITLKINDLRIKRVNTARNMGIEYCKSIPGIVSYKIITELDNHHHPHMHIILRVKHKLADSVYKSRWNRGIIEVQKLDGNWKKLSNYLIKIPKTNEFSFNEQDAEKLAKKEELLSKQVQELDRDETSAKTKFAEDRLRELYRDKNSLKNKVHSCLKLIRQYQLQVGDHNVYQSYGSGNNSKRVPNLEHKTEKELLNEYGIVRATYDHSETYTIRNVVKETGEVLGSYMNTRDVYKGNK